MKSWIKSSWIGVIAIVVVAVAAFAGEALLLSRNTAGESFYSTRDRQRQETVDHLTFVDTADAFRAGRMDHVVLHTDAPPRIALDEKPQKGFPRDGFWSTGIVQTEFPFTQLLPSWNLFAPHDTGVAFHVRTRDHASGQWTPWLRIGGWGRVDDNGSTERCELGGVTEDTLILDHPGDAYELRARLQSFGFDLDQTPVVRRITISYSGPVNEESVFAKAAHRNPGPPARWARDLAVPFRPQGDNPDAVTGMTCSPTSVSMVLHFWGINRPTIENALAIWDDRNELFGNWANAVQRCGELGMDAWCQRFHNWDEVKETIANGQPIIASIKFEKGSYDDAPLYKSTPGHLLVIRGFTEDGRVIVNDPARRNGGNGALYPPRGLGHAWFGHGGVGYVIRPPAKPIPPSLVKAFPATMPTTAPVASR